MILDNYQTDLAANIHILAGLHLFLWTDFNLIMNAVSPNKIVSTLFGSRSRGKSTNETFESVSRAKREMKHLGTLSKKNDIIWEFFPTWGGGLPKSQNFCKFTKYFFVCQIHSEVLKHVLQMGG